MKTPEPVRNRKAMLSGMTPILTEGSFVFCTSRDERILVRALPVALASFREAEGISLILSRSTAADLGLPCDLPMRRILLEVYSSLEGVGLTAAVASALSDEGIPCNMVAAYQHDHVFVPADMADRALEILKALQATAV
ncbi:ACT domain-containing protein [Rhizobium sp. S152]|uniref:ACT domain-containing protein n=1 Tax=Rhizobium sp. S152 TaxID=3055038 RepID=UPI0025A9985D|nr:ACT domain-containing protein [Rhizobium sp. S152]MDM9628081.1 ACT domain-containing protein [Rhizobium sp. S152]